MLHQVIRPVGVGHDRPPFPLDGNDRVRKFSFRLEGFFKEKDRPGKQQFPEPSRIGKKGLYGFPVELTDNDKSIRSP